MKRRGLTTSLDTYDDPEDKWGGVLDEVLSLVDLLLCTEDELAKSQRQRTPRSMLRPKCRCWLSSAERAEHLPTRMESGSTYLRSELMILIRWVRATALAQLIGNLQESAAPLPLVAQYLPRQAEAIRSQAILNNPIAMIHHKVRESLARYAESCGLALAG